LGEINLEGEKGVEKKLSGRKTEGVKKEKTGEGSELDDYFLLGPCHYGICKNLHVSYGLIAS